MRRQRIIYSAETMNQFSTFEVNNIDAILSLDAPIEGAKEFITDQNTKELIGDDTFAFINEAYDYLGGFKSFKDKAHFISDSYMWYITYEGPRPSTITDFDPEKVLVVSVYRNSHGLKLVGIARRNVGRSGSSHGQNEEIRMKANTALASHLKFMVNHNGWVEASDKLEDWCNKVLGYKEMIDPQWLKDNKILKDIEMDPYDEMHYYRYLRKGGPLLHKIAFGNPRV